MRQAPSLPATGASRPKPLHGKPVSAIRANALRNANQTQAVRPRQDPAFGCGGGINKTTTTLRRM